MPRDWRYSRTARSVSLSNTARRSSENPLRLRRNRVSASSSLSRRDFNAFSLATISSIWTRNQGSILQKPNTSSRVMPARNASATYQIRSGPGLVSSPIRASRAPSRSVSSLCSKPEEPTSRPRSAFCIDSWNVRPMAITSPTDFIWVCSCASASANFSKVKRGTLVTT